VAPEWPMDTITPFDARRRTVSIPFGRSGAIVTTRSIPREFFSAHIASSGSGSTMYSGFWAPRWLGQIQGPSRWIPSTRAPSREGVASATLLNTCSNLDFGMVTVVAKNPVTPWRASVREIVDKDFG